MSNRKTNDLSVKFNLYKLFYEALVVCFLRFMELQFLRSMSTQWLEGCVVKMSFELNMTRYFF